MIKTLVVVSGFFVMCRLAIGIWNQKKEKKFNMLCSHFLFIFIAHDRFCCSCSCCCCCCFYQEWDFLKKKKKIFFFCCHSCQYVAYKTFFVLLLAICQSVFIISPFPSNDFDRHEMNGINKIKKKKKRERAWTR